LNYERFEALLTDFLEGTLTKEDQAEMEQHMNSCPACAQAIADMRVLLQDLEQMDDSVQVPTEWSQSWRQAIREEEKMNTQQETKVRIARRPSWRVWASTAAAAVFLIAGTLTTKNLIPATQKNQQAANSTMMARSSDSAYSADYTFEENGAGGIAAAKSMAPQAAPSADESLYMANTSTAADTSAVNTPGGETLQGVKIIRTASYSLGTMQFEKDLEAIKALTASFQGWVEYVSVSGDATQGDKRYAYLTLRIPSQNLDDFKGGVTQIGRVTASDESATDVSESYSDTSMRLATQKTKMARLQKLMENAGELSDLLAVENEIANTQYQIDSYESTLRGLDSRINYTSIQVYLNEETPADAASTKDLTLGERIAQAVRASLEAIGQFFQDMAVFLVMIAPVIIPLALVLFVIIKIRKHRINKGK